MRFSFLFLNLCLFSLLFGQGSKNSYPCEEKTEVMTHPNGVSVYFEYDELDNLICIRSSDGTIHYTIEEDWEGGTYVTDLVQQKTLYRVTDCEDNLLREVFPSGHEIQVFYKNANVTGIKISSYGEIVYEYNSNELSKVKRLSPSGEILYEHVYTFDPANNHLKETLIGDLGELNHHYNPVKKELEMKSLFGQQVYKWDENQNITYRKLNKTIENFQYDNKNQLLLESLYDTQGNPIDAHVNDQGELISHRETNCVYDENGNLISKTTSKGTYRFTYDAFHRLIKASTDECEIHFTYDLFGRRLSKKVIKNGVSNEEISLYIGNNEIAVCDLQGNLKHLRIPGISSHSSLVRAVAIESSGEVYAPIYDHGCNVFQLIHSKTKEVTSFETLHPFGDNLHALYQITPWIYSSKHYDRELDLVYFGYRYYDPSLRRWISRDLEPDADCQNFYLYNLNNPLKYCDPDGRFIAVVIPVIVWGAPAGAVITKTILATAAAIGGYQAAKSFNKWKDKQIKEPPYNGKDLGKDPKKPPGDGFVWKGGKEGQWHHKKKGHSLRPDFDHPGDVKPHWDYKGPEGEAQLFLDGTWKAKK